MKAHNDWSNRHVTLRHRLLILAALVFLLSRVRIPALEVIVLDTVSGAVVTAAELAFCLSLAFFYVLVEFSARTSAEARNISHYSARLQRILHRIEEIRNRTALLFRSFEGALLSKRLHVWNDALKPASASLSASDRKLFEAIRGGIERLEASVASSQATLNGAKTEEENGEPQPLLGHGKPHRSDQASEVLDHLEKMKQIGEGFDERRRRLDRAISESRDVLADAKSFFSDNAGRGAEDLNAKLAVAVANIKAIQQELRTGSKAHYVDRYFFSVHTPRLIGLFLIILSTDVILEGAFRFANRASEIGTITLPF